MKNGIRPCSSQFLAMSVCAALLAFTASAGAQNDAEDELEVKSFPQVERKIKRLKARVKQLEADVGELQARNLPIDVAVDCGTGGSISNVLTTHADGTGELIIRVTGACNEAVTIARDNVTLIGSPTAVIQATPASEYGIVVTNGAKDVSVSDVRIVGGTGSIAVSKGAHGVFTNIVAEQSNLGVVAADNGTLDLTASISRNNTNGVYATRGGVILVSNSVLENNQIGAIANKAGTINLTSVIPDGTTGSAGVIVRNNVNGVVARANSLVELSDSRVENNSNVGVVADSGSGIAFFVSLNGSGNVVANNTGAGVVAQKGANLSFAAGPNLITANSVGIFCHPSAGYVVPAGGPGTVVGNATGQIVGCAAN